MASIIGEVREKTTGKIIEEVEKVYTTTLKKETTRGVDYRKATILLNNVFDNVQMMIFIISLILLYKYVRLYQRNKQMPEGSPTTT